MDASEDSTPSRAESDTDHIHIIVCSATQAIEYKVELERPLSALLKHYRRVYGARNSVFYTPDGDFISGEETPAALRLQNYGRVIVETAPSFG